eukprot:9763042-Alexandrium_andersonii.AAC.1
MKMLELGTDAGYDDATLDILRKDVRSLEQQVQAQRDAARSFGARLDEAVKAETDAREAVA